jgi:hypothetical protein
MRILRRLFFLLRAAFGIFPRYQAANFVRGLPAGRNCGFNGYIRFLSLLLEPQSGNPVCLETERRNLALRFTLPASSRKFADV